VTLAAGRARAFDLRRVSRWELVGVAASVVLVASLVALPWFSLAHTATRRAGDGFLCGAGHYQCTGFAAFPLLRWVLIVAACSSPILTYILARGRAMRWPPGEMTMIVGTLSAMLIAYNGIVDKPGAGIAEAGIGLDYGYVVGLACAIAIAIAGTMRAADTELRRPRRPPGVL
jgi:hypothetical protein